jgi:hypothetical protein
MLNVRLLWDFRTKQLFRKALSSAPPCPLLVEPSELLPDGDGILERLFVISIFFVDGWAVVRELDKQLFPTWRTEISSRQTGADKEDRLATHPLDAFDDLFCSAGIITRRIVAHDPPKLPQSVAIRPPRMISGRA